MKELTDLPNIGKTLADKLIKVDISTPEKLIEIGSENAFIRLQAIDDGACYNMLCALEGAIQGIRWHSLDKSRKIDLKAFFDMMKKN